MVNKIIHLSEPSFNGNEIKYLKDCINSGYVTSGKFVNKFENAISKYVGAQYAVACINATSALQISLKLAGVNYGDEVIAPSLTFIAPINAIAYNGASPIFMDSDKFYNLNEKKTIEFIENKTYYKNNCTYNNKTKKKISALIIVHIFGNAVKFDKLYNLCKNRNIEIIEDASESLGTFYNDSYNKKKHVGSKSKLSCISFNGNKIITSAGGGMIITNKLNLAKKARYLISQAKDHAVNYIHNAIGYNFRMSNIHAAIGLAQFEKIDIILEKKRKIREFYINNINKIPGLNIAETPNYAINNNWINVLQVNQNIYKKNKIQIINKLKRNNIEVRPVWYLNHLQKPYIVSQNYKIKNALNLYNISICLPSSFKINNNQLARIVKYLRK